MKQMISLHVQKRKLLVKIILLEVITLLLYALLMVVIHTKSLNIETLLQSDYLFSATANNLNEKNCYYLFDANIDFFVSPTDQTSLNADIVMQTENAEYTYTVFWNAKLLKENGIAVTKSLARKNGIKEGSVICSKHIVDDKIQEYIVEQILPDASNTITSRNSINDGIIIMGYDERYIDNISHKVLIFSEQDIEELSVDLQDVPVNIVYREDEIMILCKQALPYIGVWLLLSIISTLLVVFFIVEDIRYNYRRQIIIGIEKKTLIDSFNYVIRGLGLLFICTVFAISFIVLLTVGFNKIEIIVLVIISVINMITLEIAGKTARKWLWRN